MKTLIDTDDLRAVLTLIGPSTEHSQGDDVFAALERVREAATLTSQRVVYRGFLQRINGQRIDRSPKILVITALRRHFGYGLKEAKLLSEDGPIDITDLVMGSSDPVACVADLRAAGAILDVEGE